MKKQKFPDAILVVTRASRPSLLPLSLADLEALINGIDLLASQIEFSQVAGMVKRRVSLRKLEEKLRKAVA